MHIYSSKQVLIDTRPNSNPYQDMRGIQYLLSLQVFHTISSHLKGNFSFSFWRNADRNVNSIYLPKKIDL